MTRSTFVYVTYIRTTQEKLWSALTDEEFMKQYWFGMHCESQWTAGSSWRLVSGDGQIFDSGEIVEAEPPRRLVRTLSMRRAQVLELPRLRVSGGVGYWVQTGLMFSRRKAFS
ncbi:SRPBCC domain-containing protein [Paraburkholderia sp. BL10I2N1]|uniref:SRPBCC domain-containing protein n=1 Tax=Paraburkholderia sp. BL10I2N1 TaxID=1938796 RepID=UPI0010ECAFCD|nr:SRPBCC domain-containing protein [Paraburkholderia sp. BL10I2N1]TDN59022.1 activator of Hsp90 ATPase-like protein [Paraburkholderia sp. BL10I2N1]